MKGTTIREMKEIARANFTVASERLIELMKSRDESIALQAVQFAYLYALGKPQEGRDLAHADALQARHQELVAVPVEQPQLEAPAPAPEPEPEPVAAPVLTASEVLPPPSAPPPEAAGGVSAASVPSGLRCLYRGRDGQCQETALSTSQWCQPHRDKLFSMVPE